MQGPPKGGGRGASEGYYKVGEAPWRLAGRAVATGALGGGCHGVLPWTVWGCGVAAPRSSAACHVAGVPLRSPRRVPMQPLGNVAQ